jgi:hypothetical protein
VTAVQLTEIDVSTAPRATAVQLTEIDVSTAPRAAAFPRAAVMTVVLRRRAAQAEPVERERGPSARPGAGSAG